MASQTKLILQYPRIPCDILILTSIIVVDLAISEYICTRVLARLNCVALLRKLHAAILARPAATCALPVAIRTAIRTAILEEILTEILAAIVAIRTIILALIALLRVGVFRTNR